MDEWMDGWDGWMDKWQFYVLFNSISVISGRMDCNFMFFSTVFQSYQDDVKIIMKGCAQ